MEEINNGKTCGEAAVYYVPQDRVDSFAVPDMVEYLGWKYEVVSYSMPTSNPTTQPTATETPDKIEPCVTETVVPTTYKITYKLKGGTNHKNNPTVYTTKDIILKAPQKKGYTFEGWYLDKNYKQKITEESQFYRC